MRVKIEIECDNAAFKCAFLDGEHVCCSECAEDELTHLLSTLGRNSCHWLSTGGGAITDSNGNRVGTVAVEE